MISTPLISSSSSGTWDSIMCMTRTGSPSWWTICTPPVWMMTPDASGTAAASRDEYGVKRLYVADGISHQLALEERLAAPGKIIFGTDSHTTTYRCRGRLRLRRRLYGDGLHHRPRAAVGPGPSAIKVVVNGTLPKGVFPKDIILRVLGDLTAAGAIYKSLEFTGSTIQRSASPAGPPSPTWQWSAGPRRPCSPRTKRPPPSAAWTWRTVTGFALTGDARYERVLTYDAGTFRPYLSCPTGWTTYTPSRM